MLEGTRRIFKGFTGCVKIVYMTRKVINIDRTKPTDMRYRITNAFVLLLLNKSRNLCICASAELDLN